MRDGIEECNIEQLGGLIKKFWGGKNFIVENYKDILGDRLYTKGWFL